MDFSPTEEQQLLREQVALFVERNCNRKIVDQWDLDGTFPEEFHRAMVDMGLIGMVVPEAYGGTENSMMDLSIVLQELGRWSVDIPTRLALIGWGVMIISQSGSDELKQEILPAVCAGDIKLSFSLTEPQSGTDAASLQTRATKDGDDWILNGQKLFSTGAQHKDNMMVVAARTDPDAPKHQGISLFLVPNDAPGVTVNKLRTIGRNVLGTTEIFFDDTRVPAKHIIGEINQGWKAITAHLERERIILAANYLGNAVQVVEDAVTYASEREQFDRPIRKFQAVAHMLSEMATDLEAARWLTNYATWRFDEKLPCAKEASMAKLFTSEMLVRTTTTGMQILGGHAYTYDHSMQRFWRDARNCTVGGGTSQIQKDLINRNLTL